MGALRRKASSQLGTPPCAARPREQSSSHVDDASPTGGVKLGTTKSYRRLRLIGEGACGAVYAARHLATGDTVAIKVAHREDHDETLLREAETLAAACASNPAVVGLREVARHPVTGRVQLVMDYVGPSLADLLTHRLDADTPPRAMTEHETRGIMRQLLTGVRRLHEDGIVHRDIKPGNVLVGAGGSVRICDLGLGKSVATRPPPHTQLVGTLWYMSPEQYLGTKDYGEGVDMWALGCVMAELLTGETLFPGDTEFHQLVLVARLLGVPDEVNGMGLGVTNPSQLREKVPEEKLSQAGFDVLDGLLQYVAGNRLTAAAALEMPWFHLKEPELNHSLVK
uniref:[RNA-polymerase]-subunit kinase n=1 Tax=Leersia perrieri TaxID=77586 RepID=A0A0D9V278_9ORYZ